MKKSSRWILWWFLSVAAGLMLIFYVVSTNHNVMTWNYQDQHVPVTTHGHRYGIQQPHQHVYYLKTHKTGSTTMFSIFAEYCREQDLLPLLPRTYHINQAPPLWPSQLLLHESVLKYDMVFNHHIFTPVMLDYLHNDTFTVTTLREPFSNFVSAFNYYRLYFYLHYLTKVPDVDDPLMEFAMNHKKYETFGYRSFTNNRQSMDLGYDITNSFTDVEYIKKFIKLTEERFDFIQIMEYFDESLVMLKRALNWKTKNILYIPKNRGPNEAFVEYNSSTEGILRKVHAEFSQADILLYDYFLRKFKERMSKEVGLDEEVAEFRKVLLRVRDYCKRYALKTYNLFIGDGKWTNSFEIPPYKCKWLHLSELQITRYHKQRHYTLFGDESKKGSRK